MEKKISCSTYLSSDGGPLLLKLIIGTETLNVLVTSSCTKVNQNLITHAGPGVDFSDQLVKEDISVIFIREKERENFDNNNEIIFTKKQNLSNLRQLTSGFHDLSTYESWKSTIPESETTTHY
jgi:hypothetical protein